MKKNIIKLFTCRFAAFLKYPFPSISFLRMVTYRLQLYARIECHTEQHIHAFSILLINIYIYLCIFQINNSIFTVVRNTEQSTLFFVEFMCAVCFSIFSMHTI